MARACGGGAVNGVRPSPLWRRAVETVSDLCGVLAASMILLAVLITCQMIWVRYVANASTVWQTELVIYLMIGATLIGLPYVQRLRGHVSVDLLPSLLPAAARRVLAATVLVAAMLVIGVMLYHAAELWHLAWSRGWKSDTVWGPPLWIPYLALPLGLGLYLLQLGADLLGVVTGADDPLATKGSAHGAPLPGTPEAGTRGAGAASIDALPKRDEPHGSNRHERR